VLEGKWDIEPKYCQKITVLTKSELDFKKEFERSFLGEWKNRNQPRSARHHITPSDCFWNACWVCAFVGRALFSVHFYLLRFLSSDSFEIKFVCQKEGKPSHFCEGDRVSECLQKTQTKSFERTHKNKKRLGCSVVASCSSFEREKGSKQAQQTHPPSWEQWAREAFVDVFFIENETRHQTATVSSRKSCSCEANRIVSPKSDVWQHKKKDTNMLSFECVRVSLLKLKNTTKSATKEICLQKLIHTHGERAFALFSLWVWFLKSKASFQWARVSSS